MPGNDSIWSKVTRIYLSVNSRIKLKYILVLLLYFVLTYIGYTSTWVNKRIFDLLDNSNPSLLRTSLVLYVLLTLGKAFINAIKDYQSTVTSAQLHWDQVMFYFSKMVDSSYHIVDSIRHGECLELLWTDTWGPTAIVPMLVVNVLGGIIRTFLYFVILVLLIPHVLVIAVIQAIISMVLPGKLFQGLKHAKTKVRQAQEDLRVGVQEWYHALGEITLHGMGTHLNKYLAKLHNDLFNNELASIKCDIRVESVRTGAYRIAVVLALTTSAVAIIYGHITLGSVIAGVLLLNDFFGNVNQLAGLKADVHMHAARIDRLDRFEQKLESSNSLSSSLQVVPGILPTSIRFDSVSFGYTDSLVLDNFSCEIPHNKLTVIQGASGIGKSTILKLVLGLYAPCSGNIIVGVEPGKYGIHSAYVPQEHRWFNETLLYNLTFGRDIPETEIHKAIKLAQAEFIYERPERLNTIMSDTFLGKTMSTGQLQRLAIARALCIDAPILLMDEPSSNLDVAASQKLCQLISELAQDRTVLVVTHSPQVAILADHLIHLGGDGYDHEKEA